MNQGRRDIIWSATVFSAQTGLFVVAAFVSLTLAEILN